MREKNYYFDDTARFHRMFEKARQGKPISLLFLGASVTLGYRIPRDDQFPSLIQNYFQDTYPAANVRLHNLSAPGLPSMHGLYQCYTEAEALEADLIFIDYSINDQKSPDFREAYESLLVKALSLPSAPAVISFFVKGKGPDGYTCAPHMAAVNEHYGIAYADIGAELDEDIQDNLLSWDDYSYDDKHPGPDGHHYIASHLIWLLHTLSQSDARTYPMPEKPLFGRGLANLNFFHKSWCFFPASVELTLSCRTLFFSYMVDTKPNMGQLFVEIDGKEAFRLDSYRMDEWEHPAYKIYHIGSEKKARRLRLYTGPGGQGNACFNLLAFGYD